MLNEIKIGDLVKVIKSSPRQRYAFYEEDLGKVGIVVSQGYRGFIPDADILIDGVIASFDLDCIAIVNVYT